MRREHIRTHNPVLGREMNVIIDGHAGLPVLVFPSSEGKAADYEGFGMIDALAPLLSTGRLRRYFEIADREDLAYEQKLAKYFELSEAYFDTARFNAFCQEHLSHVDEVAHEYFTSNEFDDLLVRTVRETFQPHEHDHFVGRYRWLMSQWASNRTANAEPV